MMRWGILATGTIARKFAETVKGMEGTDELTACGSRNQEKAERFAGEFGVRKAYGSYEELLEDGEVDAVYVATPNNMHFENCRMCLEAGKHVLCEKPFTTRAEDAAELYRLAKEKGLFIMEAFWIRHLPVLRELRKLIEDGAIGKVVYARSEYGFVAAGARKDRKFDSALGGGALLDVGVYNLGFMNVVMGEGPESFSSQYHINEYGTDDFSTITLAYPGGRSATVTTAIGTVLPREAAVFGSAGEIWLPDFQKAERMVVRPNEGEEYEIEIPFEINGFEYQIREVNRCVKAGMSTSDVLTKEDTLTVLTLMDDIRNSWDMKFGYEK